MTRHFSVEAHEMDEQELETVTGGGLISSVWSYNNALRYKAGSGGFSRVGGGKDAKSIVKKWIACNKMNLF